MSKSIRAEPSLVSGALLLAASPSARAHGFGQRYDLPVPLWLWVSGAAAAVVLSFVIVGLFARSDAAAGGSPRINLLQWRLGRLLASRALRLAAQLVSVALLFLVVAAGFAGDQNPTRNLAPIWVWVIWWVGFAYVSALVGDLWRALNPWAAVFSWIDALLGGSGLGLGLAYPRRLGMWPAIVLFALFAWIELVYSGRTIPARLALLIVIYSLITWTGLFLFGRDVWLRHGDPFAAAFGLFARFSPTEDWNLRPYGAGLKRTDDVTTTMAVFVLVLLSTVAFDGFSATPAWARLEGSLYAALAPLGDARLTVIGTLGLAAFAALFGAVYWLFAAWMARAGGGDFSVDTVARVFVLSLVPIAIAYHLAHYFSYLLIQGQLVIRLASDPFGFGWNLLGTARFRPDIGIVGARFVWYTAVIAIVLGHIIAVYIAHAIALAHYPDRRAAVRSQVPMLILMVLYTIAGLWMVAQPIVE
jgi:hypothetical protein